jgi:hypothetical protein
MTIRRGVSGPPAETPKLIYFVENRYIATVIPDPE